MTERVYQAVAEEANHDAIHAVSKEAEKILALLRKYHDRFRMQCIVSNDWSYPEELVDLARSTMKKAEENMKLVIKRIREAMPERF